MKWLGLAVVGSLSFVMGLACSAQNPGTPFAPSVWGVSGGHERFRVLTVPSPVWTGTTLASDGVAGTVVLTFGDPATVVWTGPTGTYHGTVSGELPNLTITGSDNGCVYTAAGTVAQGVYSGTYSLTGTCIDQTGHGTFSVTQGTSTPCPEGQQDGPNGVGCVPIPPIVPPVVDSSWCHVADVHSQITENTLTIPAEAIQNGHVGKDGLPTDADYPHPNWKHTLDYPGTCDGRSLRTLSHGGVS